MNDVNPGLELGFYLSGGTIHMSKKAFAVELLKTGSLINELCTIWKKNVSITKTDTSVSIEIVNATGFNIGEEYESIIKKLKERHAEKIRGTLTIRVDCGHSHFVSIDLH